MVLLSSLTVRSVVVRCPFSEVTLFRGGEGPVITDSEGWFLRLLVDLPLRFRWVSLIGLKRMTPKVYNVGDTFLRRGTRPNPSLSEV